MANMIIGASKDFQLLDSLHHASVITLVMAFAKQEMSDNYLEAGLSPAIRFKAFSIDDFRPIYSLSTRSSGEDGVLTDKRLPNDHAIQLRGS